MTGRFVGFAPIVALAVTAVAVMAGARGDADTPAAAPATGVMFDQVDRPIPGNQTPPPPGSYAQELALAQRRASMKAPWEIRTTIAEQLADMALSYIPYVGPFASMAAAKAQQAEIKHERQEAQDSLAWGTLTHYAYYNGWSRAESGQYAFITRPDLGKMYTLDLKNKAYLVSDLLQNPAMPATPSPGSGADSALAWTMGGSLDLEGQATTKYDASDVMNVTQSTGGDCQQETININVTEYVSTGTEPIPLTSTALEQLALPTGCVSAITHHESGVGPQDRLYVYRVIQIEGGSAMELEMPVLPLFAHGSKPPPLANSVWLLSERANIAGIGAGDAALFSPPADFKQVQPPGAPGTHTSTSASHR